MKIYGNKKIHCDSKVESSAIKEDDDMSSDSSASINPNFTPPDFSKYTW